MIRIFSATQRAASSAQRIFEILDKQPSVPEPANPVHPGRLHGEVAIKGVRFKYGTREVLLGIDLTIRPGGMVSLVEHSNARQDDAHQPRVPHSSTWPRERS